MFENLLWLSLTARIQLKVLILICRSYLGLAPKYLCDAIRRPTSASSLRSLRSSDRLDLFVPRVRTAMAQSRAFVSIGPSLWNQLPPLVRTSTIWVSDYILSLSQNLPLFSRTFVLGAPLIGVHCERRFTNP